MPRHLLKRIVPAPHSLQERWFVRIFGERISDPHLWTLHRRGVTYAFGATEEEATAHMVFTKYVSPV